MFVIKSKCESGRNRDMSWKAELKTNTFMVNLEERTVLFLLQINPVGIHDLRLDWVKACYKMAAAVLELVGSKFYNLLNICIRKV